MTENPEPQLYTVSQIAERWQCDPEKVTKLFANFPGVIDLGTPADIRRRKKAYRILRIPPHVLTAAEEKRMVK
jgi:hypothetical protein